VVTFIAVYRGESLQRASLVAVSTDPALVAQVAATLLADREPEPEDPAADAVHKGRRRALRLLKAEAVRQLGQGAGRTGPGRAPRRSTPDGARNRAQPEGPGL
jgi:hypothetical protein